MDDTAQRSLLLWVQSFHEKLATDTQVQSLTDLCDGVFLSKIMHHIDSEYVNLEQIHEEPAGNWALKSNNLKALLRALELFYAEELGQLCAASELVDPALVAKHNDVHEVAKLTELLLGCAVQGPSKAEYIQDILEMEGWAQQSIMHAIENLMSRFQAASPSSAASRRQSVSRGASFDDLVGSPPSAVSATALLAGSSPEALAAQLAQALERNQTLELKYVDMEREKRQLAERFERTAGEQRQLEERCEALASERDKLVSERQSTLTRDNKKIQQIVEGEVHALTLELEEKKEAMAREKRESGERLMVLENELRRQADELDIARSKLGQLNKLEATVTKYKKKLEDMNALRSQVRDLEAQSAQYQDRVLDLESTIRTIPTLKELVERYKNQVVELETKNVEADSKLRVKEQRLQRLQEELDNALGGKEFLESQVEELRAQMASVQYGVGADEGGSAVEHGGLSADVLLGRDAVSNMRERVARLERENADLKSGNADARQTHLANELDVAVKAKEAMQVALFQMQKQNDQLSEDLRSERMQKQQHQQQAEAHVHASGQAHQSAAPQQGQQWQDAASGPQPMQVAEDMEVEAASGVAGPIAVAGESGFTQTPVAQEAGAIVAAASAGNLGAGMVTSSNNALSTAQIADYEGKLEKLKDEAEAVDSMRETVTELTKRLKEKESMINELSEQRAKLENYTKKTLHAVQTKYMVAVSSHRNQINEKQERVDFLEKKMKEVRASYSREQALMMSSFYEIGTEMQRRTMMPQGPAAGAPGGGSWLASKRTEERAKRRQV